MGEKRFGLAALVITMLMTAVVVTAAMVLISPRLSPQLARTNEAGTTSLPAQPMAPALASTSPTVTASATRPPPSPTPTRRPTATPTRRPTQTPTASPTALPDAVVLAETLNLRDGPGTVYARVGVLAKGDPLDVVTRNPAGDWLAVVASNGNQGWVAANLVQLNVPVSQVSVANDIPTPPVTPTPRATATPRPTLSVDEQIAALAQGQHGQLPQPSATGSVAAGGDAELTILNDTPYQLTVLIGSPNGVTVAVEPCAACRVYQGAGPLACQESGRPRQVVRIKPGTMQVAARVSDPGVVPFLGAWTLNGDTGYFNCFFIMMRNF